MKLIRLFNKLLKRVKKISPVSKSSPFTDLTPVDNADPDGCYTKALSFALKNSRIKNIALTGPYGSGKSSIIRTFENNSDYKFLNISLASFKEDNINSINSTLIERSILQQMLYGADANKLPYSRFKRIAKPEHPLIKSLLLIAWPIAAILLYSYRAEFLDIESFSFSLFWLSGISLFSFTIALTAVLVFDVYKASFGLTLQKFSLKNAEIETGEPSEKSILNRHLDEIIYFFQETVYDVVVIEDLDRFGNPEIFVKLREINKLINDNEKTKGQIKFLYAIKDDMFAHKDRTKFFDFIIPVVPIINSSNSLDKMQERLKEHDFAKNIDTQFLRETSLYIDDLRLIHNIFNEFVIYHDRLKSESLNIEKLLAMMIYKNTYPSDFEKLHHGKGALFEICEKKTEYLRKLKTKLEGQLEVLRSLTELANTEKARNIRELINTYVGHIVMYSSQPVFGVVYNNQHIGFSQLTTFERFEPMFSENPIQLATHQQTHPNHRMSTGKSFSQIEEEINPGETFLSRKENIENNSEPKNIELQQNIKLIEREITELSKLQIFQLIQSGDIELNELINGHKIPDCRLLTYLVRNGYLDDNYHLYISNFHEGRLTKNDRDYILTIRNFNQSDPSQIIDTPKEVCANMREEDFRHKYVLNVNLIDYLLETKVTSLKFIESAMDYIAKHFEQSEVFFTAYFITGKYLDEFILYLSHVWPGFSQAAISSKHCLDHISSILKFVDAEHVNEFMNTDNLLTDYLSEHGHLILTSDLQLPNGYNVLKLLNVRFHDLALLEKCSAVLDFAHDECLYTITSKNINFTLQLFGASQNVDTIKFEKANYTSILAFGSSSLKEYIEENLPYYIEKVLLNLPDNSEEGEASIKKLINHEMVHDDLREKIISQQDYIFETFEGIPEYLWDLLLLEEKVTISWENISDYLSNEDNDKEVVTELLCRQNIVDTLSNLNISISNLGKDKNLSISRFIINNDEMKDSDYCRLIQCLPIRFTSFPTDVSEEKIKCLAKEGTIVLSESSFKFTNDNNHLTATLISENFNKYLDQQEIYPISDDVRELLLASEISNENKITICLDVTPSGAMASKKLSRLVASLLVSNEIECSSIDDSVLSSAVINAQTTSNSIQLLMKCLSSWDERQTMEVLAELPEPFCKISSYGKITKLENNTINLAFSRLLDTRNFVSSIKVKDRSIKINTFKSSDHS